MADIIGYNWDATPIYGLKEVVFKAPAKNTYAGPWNHDYYNAQNGTNYSTDTGGVKTWNEIASGLFGTPPPAATQAKPPNNTIIIAAAIIAAIIITFIMLKNNQMADYDYNNLTNSISNNAPATIAALAGLFQKPVQPILNVYQEPKSAMGVNGGSTTLIIGIAAAALIITLVLLKK